MCSTAKNATNWSFSITTLLQYVYYYATNRRAFDTFPHSTPIYNIRILYVRTFRNVHLIYVYFRWDCSSNSVGFMYNSNTCRRIIYVYHMSENRLLADIHSGSNPHSSVTWPSINMSYDDTWLIYHCTSKNNNLEWYSPYNISFLCFDTYHNLSVYV